MDIIPKIFQTKTPDVAATPEQQLEIQDKETYQQYGFRMAGVSQGNPTAFQPHLHSIFEGLKKKQAANENKQAELRKLFELEKNKLITQKETAGNELDRIETEINKVEDDIKQKEGKLNGLAQERYTRNQKAWIQLIISTIILVPFTIYFFIFYSSVAYSAFFKNFTADANLDELLTAAILDSKALPAAYEAGLGSLLFVLLMPMIFLAFGFVLNRFENETGLAKYIKIPFIIIVAFVFDFLLAYEICEKIYNIHSLTTLEQLPPYSVSAAVQDPKLWIIICLGFVSYLIWGFVFNYFVQAIDKLDLNSVLKSQLEKDIKELKNKLQAEKDKADKLHNKITALKAQICDIDIKIQSRVTYDLNEIKLELNNFLTGWLNYLSACQTTLSATYLDAVKIIFKDFMNNLKEDKTPNIAIS